MQFGSHDLHLVHCYVFLHWYVDSSLQKTRVVSLNPPHSLLGGFSWRSWSEIVSGPIWCESSISFIHIHINFNINLQIVYGLFDISNNLVKKCMLSLSFKWSSINQYRPISSKLASASQSRLSPLLELGPFWVLGRSQQVVVLMCKHQWWMISWLKNFQTLEHLSGHRNHIATLSYQAVILIPSPHM